MNAPTPDTPCRSGPRGFPARLAALAGWVRGAPAARALAGTTAAVLLWTFSSKGVADVLIWGAFLAALVRAGRATAPGAEPGGQPTWPFWRAAAPWLQPAGLAFVAALFYRVFTLPVALYPALAWRDFTGDVRILAGAFAIAALFNNRARIAAALLASAAAIALTLGADLIRLALRLGPALLARGRFYEPAVLNHPNVASMMAGASAIIFLAGLWTRRRRLWPALGCLLGALVCLAHLLVMAARGPQLAFALTLAGAGLLIPRWTGKAAWLLGAGLAGLLLVLNLERVNPRFLERASMQTFSERETVWRHTRALARARPWFGYGYGKRIFEKVYYASTPPRARFHYPHPHQFWLKILFESGRVGLALHAAAWALLGWGLLRRTLAEPSFDGRLWPGTVLLMLAFVHLYGLGDYPDNIVRTAQLWLVPAALVLMRDRAGCSPHETG